MIKKKRRERKKKDERRKRQIKREIRYERDKSQNNAFY